MPLIVISSAWVAGIFLGSKLGLPAILALTSLTPLLLLPLLRQHRKRLVMASLCLLAIFFGTLRFQSVPPPADKSSLQSYNGQTVEVRGIVQSDPAVSGRYIHVRLSAQEIKLEDGGQPVSGAALLFVPGFPGCRYGDELIARGKLETPPQLGDFDYQAYLAHEDIYSIMRFPAVEIVGHGKGSRLLEWIYSARNRLSETLAAVLPEPQAALVQGMVLGIRGNIPDWLNTEMSRTGTTHILAISGLNISIVAGILLGLGIWLFGRRRYIYVWLALVTVWLYALLTGMNPPVVRGTVMASLFFFAEIMGRQRGGLTALAFAAAVMVGISPQILWNASFQMSFLAMFGLVTIAPILQNIGRGAIARGLGEDGPFVSAARFAADSLAVSLGAIIAVWPVIAYYFGIFAYVSPLATLLILPVLPGIIVTGTLAGAIGLFLLPLAQFIGWLAWLFTSYMLLIVHGFAAVPSSAGLSLSHTAIVSYYLALGAAVWLINNRRKTSYGLSRAAARMKSGADRSAQLVMRLPVKWTIPPLLVLAILASVTVTTMPDDRLHVSFLDVGQGDAILIQTPARQDILIDGGPDPGKLSLALGEKMPFWDRTIDLVILTHPHQDHLYGLVEVLRRYNVRQVLAPDLPDSPMYEEWKKLLLERGIPCTIARAGQRLDLAETISMSVLHPAIPLTGTDSDVDNNSIVLRLDTGRIGFLFSADIMREAEWELIAWRAELTSTVLKVAHHGSKNSTTPEFLAVAHPGLAVISAGADNRFGHPDLETLARLRDRLGEANIYRTDQHGTIEVITDGERLWMRTGK